MNEEQQRIAIAKACGWKSIRQDNNQPERTMNDTPRTDDSETRVRKNGFSSLIEYCYANDMAKLERELTAVTEQRDRLAEALRDIVNGTSCQECGGEDQARFAREALQSLTTNEL
jgi:hypothetical protein